MHSDRRFRALIEQSIDAIVLLTPEGAVTYASPSIERILGYTPQEFMAINVYDVIHPGDIPSLPRTFQHLLATPGLVETHQFRSRHKDGSWRWVEAAATNLLHNPDVQALVTNLHDITERKQTDDEQQHQYSERKWRMLVESNIFGMAVTDGTGRIYEVNDRFAQVVGYQKDELLAGSFNWYQLVPRDTQEVQAHVEKTLLPTGALFPQERESLRKDGSRVPILMAGALFDKERDLAMTVILDMSEQKEAVRRKQEFLSMVSHELRTPLQSIMGYIELALLYNELLSSLHSPDVGELTDKIETVLKQALGRVHIEARLVGELLDVARLEMQKFELSLQRENLVAIVQETVGNQQQAARTRSIELVLPPDEEVPVLVDASRIGQVLTNYLTNALKYTPINQSISVRLDVEASSARVSVRDQGPGLTPEQQQRAWERFFQVAAPGHQGPEGGLGLGLAIAKALVEQHHGEVGVQSAPGHGATFWFTLPIEGPPEE